MLEEEMSAVFPEAAKKWGFKDITPEIPIFNRCADYVMRTPNGTLISVELKVSKWRHAMEQAYTHGAAADYAFICLPTGYHTEKFYDALRRANLGLFELSVESKTLRIVKIPTHRRNVPMYRDQLEERMALFHVKQ